MMQSYNILLVVPTLERGGVERYCIDLAVGLKENGWNPIVVSAGGILVKELLRADIKHIQLPVHSKNLFSINKNAKTLAKIIKSENIDIVHANSRAPAWACYKACKLTGTKFMTTFHAAYGLGYFGLKRKYNKVMVKGDIIIAPSYFIANHIVENYKVDGFSLQENKISSKKFGVKKYFFSSPIIVDNILYTLDAKGNLIAKDINNLDKTLWKTSIINKNNYINYFGGKITYYNDVIYIADRINEIIAVSKDGEILWEKQLNAVPISTPVVYENTIYVITNDNKLYALDTDGGRIKWINYGTAKSSAILGSANPVIYKDYVIASYSSGELVIMNRKTSEVIYTSNLTGRYFIFSNFELTDIDSTPIIKDNILIATASNGVTEAINLDNMQVLWKQNFPSLTNIVINNDFAYLITTDNIVMSLNIKDGKVAWYTQLDTFKDMKKKKDLIYYKAIAIINNKLYAFNNVNQYKIIDPYNGNVLENKETEFNFYNIPYSLNNKLYGIVENGRNVELVIFQ